MSKFVIGICTECHQYMAIGGCTTIEADARHERGIAGLEALGITVYFFDKIDDDGCIVGWETDEQCDICDTVGGIHWRAMAMDEPPVVSDENKVLASKKFQNEQAEKFYLLALDGGHDGEAIYTDGTLYTFFYRSSYEGVVMWEDSQGFVSIAECSPHEWDEMQAEWGDMESDDI